LKEKRDGQKQAKKGVGNNLIGNVLQLKRLEYFFIKAKFLVQGVLQK